MSTDPELDALLRELERTLSARDWDGVLRLRARARAAFERGRQHWPAAAHAEYRLALEAPGEYAGQVVVEGAGQFAFGPLAEVAASTHTWRELREHIPAGPLRAIVAHERVVRGEDLRDDDSIDRAVLPLPLAVLPYEPHRYPTATYRPDKADFPAPVLPRLHPLDANGVTRTIDADVQPLLDIARTWTSQSNGTARAVAVEGDARAAAGALGATHVADVDAAAALALLAWTAASGGAHGRRRGMAWGRYAAWSAIAGVADVDVDAVPEVIDELAFVVFDDGGPPTGWSCRLAITDTVDGVAFALAAGDRAAAATQL